MKLLSENTIKIIFSTRFMVSCNIKRLVPDYSSTSLLYLCNILPGGVDNERGDSLCLAYQYRPGTIIELFL
jgi:hypothetical protein